jgi:hypothetical protein
VIALIEKKQSVEAACGRNYNPAKITNEHGLGSRGREFFEVGCYRVLKCFIWSLKQFTELTGRSTPEWFEDAASKDRFMARLAQLRMPRPPQEWINYKKDEEWHMRFSLMWLDFFATTLPFKYNPETIIARNFLIIKFIKTRFLFLICI